MFPTVKHTHRLMCAPPALFGPAIKGTDVFFVFYLIRHNPPSCNWVTCHSSAHASHCTAERRGMEGLRVVPSRKLCVSPPAPECSFPSVACMATWKKWGFLEHQTVPLITTLNPTMQLPEHQPPSKSNPKDGDSSFMLWVSSK